MIPNWPALEREAALPEYAGLDNAQASDHHNAKVVTKLRRALVMEGGILRILGREDGATALGILAQAAQANPVLAVANRALTGAAQGIDLGDEATREMLDVMSNAAGGPFADAWVVKLKAAGEYTVPAYAEPGGFGMATSEHDWAAVRGTN